MSFGFRSCEGGWLLTAGLRRRVGGVRSSNGGGEWWDAAVHGGGGQRLDGSIHGASTDGKWRLQGPVRVGHVTSKIPNINKVERQPTKMNKIYLVLFGSSHVSCIKAFVSMLKGNTNKSRMSQRKS